MNFYEEKILPYVIDFACSQPAVMELREKIVPLAEGNVLEIGMGSGTNLCLYNPKKVTKVFGLEPSKGMRERAQKNLEKSPVKVELLDLPGEAIPLEDESVDSIVLTYTLCSIPDWNTAMKQMYRVLKPGGKLFFCEHGRAPEASVQRFQDKLTPMWKKIGGGCHLNRPTRDYIEQTGFSIESIQQFYMDKAPRFVGYMSYGVAIKA